MTDEFPRARLPIVRYLHEEMGFDVLALKSSAVDSWVAQDHLYHSKDPSRIADAQRLARFGLWQTEAMAKVMKYVAATQDSPTALYLTGFDAQQLVSEQRPEGTASFFQAVAAYRCGKRWRIRTPLSNAKSTQPTITR